MRTPSTLKRYAVDLDVDQVERLRRGQSLSLTQFIKLMFDIAEASGDISQLPLTRQGRAFRIFDVTGTADSLRPTLAGVSAPAPDVSPVPTEFPALQAPGPSASHYPVTPALAPPPTPVAAPAIQAPVAVQAPWTTTQPAPVAVQAPWTTTQPAPVAVQAPWTTTQPAPAPLDDDALWDQVVNLATADAYKNPQIVLDGLRGMPEKWATYLAWPADMRWTLAASIQAKFIDAQARKPKPKDVRREKDNPGGPPPRGKSYWSRNMIVSTFDAEAYTGIPESGFLDDAGLPADVALPALPCRTAHDPLPQFDLLFCLPDLLDWIGMTWETYGLTLGFHTIKVSESRWPGIGVDDVIDLAWEAKDRGYLDDVTFPQVEAWARDQALP